MVDVELTRRVLQAHPELRVSDIPQSGLILEGGYILLCNDEGEVAVFPLDPNAE